MRFFMAYGSPIDTNIVDRLPDTEFVDMRDLGFFRDERGNWKPCRVSFTRWYPSFGRWENFGGYRSIDGGRFHYSTCAHRDVGMSEAAAKRLFGEDDCDWLQGMVGTWAGYPRSFQHEEMNFHESMGIDKGQAMHDKVVSSTRPARIITIMNDHQSGHLENFHMVTRKEGSNLFLDFVFEDVFYEPEDIPYDRLGLDHIRAREALVAPELRPCDQCVKDGGISLVVRMENVHGAYGTGPMLTGKGRSKINDMTPNQWLILDLGQKFLAIPYGVLYGIRGNAFGGLRCFPTV